jgi:hypothetical protein
MEILDPNHFVLHSSSLIESLPKVLEAAKKSGKTIQAIRTHQPTLEDVFVALTGRHLRDEGASS